MFGLTQLLRSEIFAGYLLGLTALLSTSWINIATLENQLYQQPGTLVLTRPAALAISKPAHRLTVTLEASFLRTTGPSFTVYRTMAAYPELFNTAFLQLGI